LLVRWAAGSGVEWLQGLVWRVARVKARGG
jgi:hypothetical protein